MSTNGNKLSRYSRNLWLTVGMAVILAILFAVYSRAEKEIDRANDLRHRSFLLADELRQSSDDLTRMARLYAVTGNPRYKDYYQQILDIRDGMEPRPLDYQNIYWDLVLANGMLPRPDSGQAAPLLELMRQAGFTREELQKLEQAKANSDALVISEREAMTLAESGGNDAETRRGVARMMLFDDNYHQTKAAIMKPISEFIVMMDRRTEDAVLAAENQAAIWRDVFIAFFLWLMFMLWRSYNILRTTLSTRIHDAAIASSINAIAIAGLDGKLSYVNQAYADLWRLQGTEGAIGRSPLEFLDKPEEGQAALEILRQQGHWRGELRARRDDGSTADLELSANLIKDSSGRPLSMMATFVDVSARRLAEQELQKSNALLDSLLTHMPVMMFLKRASDLRIEKFNRAAELLTGYSAQEMLGKSDRDMFPPEQAEFYIATDREALASHRMIDVPQEPVTTRSGETRLLHTRKIGVYDAAGEPTYLLGIAMDITERVWAEEVLREREASLRAILDNSPYMSWLKDCDGRYVMVNKAYAKYFGLENVAQVIGKTDLNFQKKELAEKYRDDDADVMATRLQKRFEDPSFDGKRIHYMETFKTPVIDENGNVLGTTGFARDITERKEIEEVQKRYKQVIEHTREGYLLMDEQGDLVEVNQAYADLTGYSVEELLHMHIQQLQGKGRTPDDVKTQMDMVMRHGSDQFELAHRHKDGHDIPIEISAIFMSETRQFAAFIRDISERKQSETVLKKHKQVIELSNDGFWIVDTTTGNITETNEAYARISGYTVDELVGMQVSQLEAREQADETHAHIEKIVTRGYDNFETRHRHRDGHVIDIDVSTVYIRETRQIAAFFRDITERKRVQRELQHNQDMLNAAQRLGQLGSWERNLVNGELRWSDEVYRILELDPNLFTPSHENFLSVVHPEDRDLVMSAYTRSLEDRQGYEIEHRLRMADGRIKWVNEYCISEFDASGKPLRSVGAVQDITRQKLLQERLREAAVAFETHEAIMITDANANIVRVNRAFSELTGYSAEEVLGKNPRILSSGRQNRTFYAAMWGELLEEGTWSGELWDRSKDGREYPKWLTITAVENELGETTGYVGIFADISARKKAEEEIRNLAFYDSLTSLPNRRLLLDRLHLATSVSARSNQYGAVLFLDLDRFKTINDTIGHDHGDLLLVEAAQRIRQCVRDMDTVARLGGDEFVMLVEEIGVEAQETSQKVALVAEKIRAALTVPYQILGNEYHSSASIGVCLYRGAEEPVEALLKHADLAMYQAKDAGRNTVRFFDPLMQQLVENHAALEADLRSAVSNRQLLLHYQIQVDNEHRPLGAEVLVRWIHPSRGMVMPGQFISIAEESSLILQIGDWVLDAACGQLAEWSKNEPMRDLQLAVNVSGQQFRMHDFVDRVEAVVHAHRIDPSRLKLELTESVVLGDIADVVKKMHALKAIGVKLAMDDFGTGYSSLSNLKQLPLDQLKIDQSFVRDIAIDPNDAVMVETIIDMARNFRLNVIAEGVENEAQLKFLKEHGCMAYQGYLFGKPVPLAEFEALLGKS
jgi:diguanylate cyclase (GGDEF)-like protein/PAS domain S-box-containing protein